MKVTPQEVIHDLIANPGLGMFAWICLVYFIIASIFFFWALCSGQMNGIEDIKFDMLEENPSKEVQRNG